MNGSFPADDAARFYTPNDGKQPGVNAMVPTRLINVRDCSDLVPPEPERSADSHLRLPAAISPEAWAAAASCGRRHRANAALRAE